MSTATTARKKTAKKKASKPAKPAKGAKAESNGALTVAGFDYGALTTKDADKLRGFAAIFQRAAGEQVRSAVQMGAALAQAQELCQARAIENPDTGRGYSFAAWLRYEAKISPASATRYLQVYNRLGDHAELLKAASPTALYLLAQSQTPDAAVKEASKAAAKHPGSKLGDDEIRKIVRKHRALAAASEGTVAVDIPDPLETVEVDTAEPTNEQGEGLCPRGGEHKWTSDGEGGTFCEQCHAAKGRRRRLPRLERQKLANMLGKLVRHLNKLGAYEAVRDELTALNKAMGEL